MSNNFKFSLRIRALFFVVLPTLVAGLYFGFLATDMYVSESRFAIRSPEGGSSSDWLSLLGQAGGGGTANDAYILEDYILSPDLLVALDAKLHLKKHYQNPQADLISQLKKEPTAEEFIEYYRGVVSVRFDSATGIMHLKVRAFTPVMARSIGEEILNYSEQLVNKLRDRAMDDLLSLSRREVQVAEKRLSLARQQIKQFRQESDLLDPQAAAGAVLGLVTELEGQAARARAELAEMRSYMQETSAGIVALKAKIRAVEDQVVAEKERLIGENDQVINEVVGRFEELTVEHEFAQSQYLSALTSLEAARVRAESQSRYLIDFVAPTLPDDALWPRRWLSIGLSFACAILIFGVGSLTIAAVREHAGS